MLRRFNFVLTLLVAGCVWTSHCRAADAPPAAADDDTTATPTPSLFSTLATVINTTPTAASTPTPPPAAAPETPAAVPGAAATPAPAATPAQAQAAGDPQVQQKLRGQQVLVQMCMECHGHNKGPNLVMRRYSANIIKKTVRMGKGKRMPAFPEAKVSNPDLDAIVAYLMDVEARYAPAKAPRSTTPRTPRTR